MEPRGPKVAQALRVAVGIWAWVGAAVARAIAGAGGWLPFDRFMSMALYAPGLGYYAP